MLQRNNHYTTANQLKLSKNHNNLLPILFKRLTFKTLHNAYTSITNYSNHHKNKLRRMDKICTLNQLVCVFIAWQKLRMNCKLVKTKERVIKDAFILMNRVRGNILREAFYRLQSYGSHKNKSVFHLLRESRRNIMLQNLKRLSVKCKVHAWHKLKNNVKATKNLKRLFVVNVIMTGAIRRNLIYCWCKLGNEKGKQIKMQPAPDFTDKISDLNHQIEDYKVQVENKTQNITRLQQELTQLKQASFMQTQNNSMLFNNSFQTKTYRNRNKSISNSSDKDKDPNNGSSLFRDSSYGSILGHSFLSSRSKGSNAGSKAEWCGCHTCGYKERYQKHKASSETLKKQLEIIKTELQFTKDMNEHLQNEIRNHLGDDEREKKMEVLRNELKESQKEKDNLKQKIVKYEKYVSKLKMQFKTKIQEIYRRVKKNA